MSKQPTSSNPFQNIGGQMGAFNPFGMPPYGQFPQLNPQNPSPTTQSSQTSKPSTSSTSPIVNQGAPSNMAPPKNVPFVPPYSPFVPPQMPPMRAPPAPFIGSSITLISNAGIRYEGTLHSIDPENSCVALKDVKMYGTEGRRDGQEILPQDKIYNLIRFKSSDIQDLTVNQANQYMGYPFMPQGGFMPPQQGFIPSMPHTTFMPPMPQGGFYSPMMAPPTASQPLKVTPPKKSNISVMDAQSTEQQQQPSTTTTAPAAEKEAEVKQPATAETTEPVVEAKTETTVEPVPAPETKPEPVETKPAKENAWKKNDKKKPTMFDQDFDFAANTEKWDEEKANILGNISTTGPVYNKSNFFDNIEPEQKVKYDAKEAYKMDIETFGTTALSLHRQRRNQSYRGGGRGRGNPNYKRRGGYQRGNDRRGGRGGHKNSD